MSLLFSGNQPVNHGDINQIDGAVAFTACMWANPDISDANRRLLWAKGVSGTSPGMAVGGLGTVVADAIGLAYTSNNFGEALSVFVLRKWVHVAYIYDGNQPDNASRLKCFANGRQVTLSFTGTIGATLPSSATVLNINQIYDSVFSGKLAHIKMWTAALAPREVLREMLWREPQTHRRDLILWAPYENGVNDYSGRRNHGTQTAGSVRADGPNVLRLAKRSPLRQGGRLFGNFLPFMHPSFTS